MQMSLDVKKAEILKLDARAKDKEEARGAERVAPEGVGAGGQADGYDHRCPFRLFC